MLASVLLVAGCVGESTPLPQPTVAPSPTTATPSASSSPSIVPSPTASAPAGVALARSPIAYVAADPARAGAAAEAMNAFGLALYARLAVAPGNLVMSPASVAIALSMTRAGAAGTTAAEMDAVLHDLGSDRMGEAINALAAALAARSGTFPDAGGVNQAVSLRIANGLFAQWDMALKAPYLDALGGRYDAGVWQLDYKADPEAARKVINAWVAENTEQRIPEILKPGQITTGTRLALANAIYLKAAWLNPFDKAATKPGTFTRADATTVQVPLMKQQAILPYAAGNGWQAIQLPYVGGSLAMTVIVPTDLGAFERRLDAATFASVVADLKPTLVNLALPSFDTGAKAELSPMLKALGMPSAFDSGKADFSGITTDEALHIGFVIHQANITVDEAGTEAAAATVIGMDTAGPGSPPVELRVDHPFLFALRDVSTGAIVFMGRVADPSVLRSDT